MTPRRMVGAVIAALMTALLAFPAAAAAETVGGEGLAATGPTVTLLDGADPPPKVHAKTWIVIDATTGEVLAHKGAHVKRAPASTLKILTALTVMPKLSPDQAYVATPSAAYTYGSRVGLKPGKSYTLDQLWYAVLLASANDAAIAVAEANGGVKKTVAEMNDMAASLGAFDTVAKTPNGLDQPGQTSSAYDLALLARNAMQREDFARYVGTKDAQFPNVKGRRTHTIVNTNRLLRHGYKGAIGVKTGYTSRAGRTYVGAAERRGTRLIIVAMGIRGSSEGAGRALLNWGFRNRDKVTPVGQIVAPTPSPSPAQPDVTSVQAASVVPMAAPASTRLPVPVLSSVHPAVVIAVAGAALLLAIVLLSAFRRRRLHPHRGQHQA